MPYAGRNAEGVITGRFACEQYPDQEWVDDPQFNVLDVTTATIKRINTWRDADNSNLSEV